ncbi:MAG: hypothetical protein HWE22_13540 [Flavobacteriales bacterium]|nr:hypothetical protein [Flavobacteriales bacterium]
MKTRKMVSFDKLEPSLKKQLLRDHPDGFEDVAMRIDAPTPFHAVLLEAEDVTYLVKLNNYVVTAASLEDDDDDDDNDDIDVDADDLEMDDDD